MVRGILNPKEDRRLLRGHRWVYRNEFDLLPDLSDGALLDVYSNKGRFVGRGFYQATGGIAVRILTYEREDIDASFFRRRIDAAKALRDRLYPSETVYRWVYGDSDRLPGFVADRYGPVVAARAEPAFYAMAADDLAEAFLAHEGVEGVILRRGGETRYFGATETPVECSVNGLRFSVEPDAGQKTGLFLDQRENWKLLERYAPGRRVLDGHCYTGAWGMHAGKYGAARVLGVDTSQRAIETALGNAELNGLSEVCGYECADIQDVLARDDTWDVIVLDPPAFAKSRAHTKKALRRYQALNRDAMQRIEPGGILITSSCSQPVDFAAFMETLKRAGNAAQRVVQLLDQRGPAPDHPALLAMPETNYLKCVVLRVV